MPRYEVKRSIPATYEERYIVDASSPDEARRAVLSGRGRCHEQVFQTTPISGSAASYPLEVLESSFTVADERVADPTEFCDARFFDNPGATGQTAIRRFGQ